MPALYTDPYNLSPNFDEIKNLDKIFKLYETDHTRKKLEYEGTRRLKRNKGLNNQDSQSLLRSAFAREGIGLILSTFYKVVTLS